MNYAVIKYNDVSNGPGIRTSLYVSGCTHRCKGCFNEVTWDFNYGEKYTKNTENEIIESLSSPYVKGITLLGGEPFEEQNRGDLITLLKRVRREHPEKTVWCFSGYTFEEMTLGELSKSCSTGELLSLIDVLVDGKFILELKDPSLKFKGSSNQRTIDVKKSLSSGTVSLIKEYN